MCYLGDYRLLTAMREVRGLLRNELLKHKTAL